MQIMVFSLILIALAAFIIYKVNDKFETKEIIILITLIVIIIGTTILLLNKDENVLPEIFKTKYEASKNVEIIKLSSERLNNKTTSSKTNFVYRFDYIINKDNKELVCTANSVKIKKIEDEYVFENFDNFNEKCSSK
jgi:ABC-type uncharacterized transport system substrate-binding protein